MFNAILWIVVGAVLIALGGALGTYGWNRVSDVKAQERAAEEVAGQREAILRTLAAESTVNLTILRAPAFTETDPEKLTGLVPLPKLQIIALDSAVSTGLFAGPDDKELFAAIVSLRHNLAEFNDRTDMGEVVMRSGSPAALTYRSRLPESEMVTRNRARIVAFTELLIRHGIDPNEGFFDTSGTTPGPESDPQSATAP